MLFFYFRIHPELSYINILFLHFGFDHLMNNMVVLLFVGNRLETELGKIKYLFVYLAGGLCGSIASALWDI